MGSAFCSEGNTACAYVCPGLPRPRLTLASQFSDLWNFKNPQEASHFSVYLQVKITDRDPQAGRSLLGPPLSSHCPHAPFPVRKGQGSTPSEPPTDQQASHPHPRSAQGCVRAGVESASRRGSFQRGTGLPPAAGTCIPRVQERQGERR